MRILPLVLATALLGGCTAPIYKISLTPNPVAANTRSVSVVDDRLDELVYITGLSIVGTDVYSYEVEPKLAEALRGAISLALGDLTPTREVTVTITDLEILERVGFLKEHEVSSIMESRVQVGSSPATEIRSRGLEMEETSDYIRKSGQLIIDQCVAEHARDIARYISEAESSRADEEVTPPVRPDETTSSDGPTDTVGAREGRRTPAGP